MTKSPGAWKHFVAAFVLALILYVVGFNFIESRRVKSGPWDVTFQNSAGQLELVIQQDSLSIRDVRIQFTNAPLSSNLAETIYFTAGRKVPFAVPFGRCVFLDPLFLPGKAVLEIAGHEIQIMPRVLVLNGKEHSWASGTRILLSEVEHEETVK